MNCLNGVKNRQVKLFPTNKQTDIIGRDIFHMEYIVLTFQFLRGYVANIQKRRPSSPAIS